MSFGLTHSPWLDHLVGIPRYRLAGWALIGGPVVLAAVLDGITLTASTRIAAGALLLLIAAAGFRDLGHEETPAL